MAGVQAVLQVVHGVGDVVGPVHDLRLEARPLPRHAVAHPREDLLVVLVHAVLGTAHTPGPGVLHRGVERGAREVEAGAVAVLTEGLGLQPGEQPQALRVALEPAARRRDLVERGLPVVPERRMPQVMGETGDLDEVGVAAERLAELPPDLRALERVREPGARAVPAVVVVALGELDDLRLGREPPQRGTVQHPRPVAFEGRTATALGRLGRPAPAVVFGVAVHRTIERTSPPGRSRRGHPARKFVPLPCSREWGT